VQIVRAWHGTTYTAARSIMENGFANLSHLDEGWFGKGIYFSSFPEYHTMLTPPYFTFKFDLLQICCKILSHKTRSMSYSLLFGDF